MKVTDEMVEAALSADVGVFRVRDVIDVGDGAAASVMRAALEAALSHAAGQEAVIPARDVFRIAGGDTECRPNPSAKEAMDCLTDLRACYDEAISESRGHAIAEVIAACGGFGFKAVVPFAELERLVNIGERLYLARPSTSAEVGRDD